MSEGALQETDGLSDSKLGLIPMNEQSLLSEWEKEREREGGGGGERQTDRQR